MDLVSGEGPGELLDIAQQDNMRLTVISNFKRPELSHKCSFNGWPMRIRFGVLDWSMR